MPSKADIERDLKAWHDAESGGKRGKKPRLTSYDDAWKECITEAIGKANPGGGPHSLEWYSDAAVRLHAKKTG